MTVTHQIYDDRFVKRKFDGYQVEIPIERGPEFVKWPSYDPSSNSIRDTFKIWVMDKGPYRLRMYNDKMYIWFAREETAMLFKLTYL